MNIQKFLENKEKRVYYLNKIRKKYKLPILTVRTNIPGEKKNIPLSDNITVAVSKEIDLIFENDIKYKEEYRNLEGLFEIYVIDNKPEKIKEKVIILEETHELGRCVDIDVYDILGNSLSRKYFGYSERKCFICNNIAHSCTRSMKHSYDELYNFLEEKYKNYLAHKLSMIATETAIYEVSVYPSFGLVSLVNSGSHKDMDFYTFLDSSFAIERAFYEITRVGYSNISLEKAFRYAREIGKKVEKSMFKKTNNINTHKGLIFLMGTLILAVSRNYYLGNDKENIPKLIKKITKDILKDFDNIATKSKDKLTNGEKLYIKYGFTGIRGEINDGLEKVFYKILPFYDRNVKKYNKKIASSMTLIYLMSMLEDSTIVHRHNIKKLNEIKEAAKKLINVSDLDKLVEFEKKCISENISPGGSADMLAITLFLHRLYY